MPNPPCQSIRAPAWSPDRTRIAFACSTATSGVYVIDPDGNNLAQLTSDGVDPAWSPDGGMLAFTCSRLSGLFTITGICVMNADGTGRHEVRVLDFSRWPVWSPSGMRIAFYDDGNGGLSNFQDIYSMNPDGSGVVNLTNNASAIWWVPAWSPDGTRIAFHSPGPNYGGNSAGIYVMDAADGQHRVLVHSTGSTVTVPSWSPDGTKIAFATRDSDLFIMNPDGTGVTQITTGGRYEMGHGSWW
jgi:TolB protein